MEIFLFIIIGLLLYFLPFIVAKLRDSDRSAQVFIINLFFGWSGIGWVVALVIAVGKNKK